MEGITIGLTAFGLGVLHALEPGHGKTLMAGTLVGSKHRWLDPIMLAVSTAIGHAIGIVFFVIVSFWIAHEFAAEELRHTVELVSGMVVLSVGTVLSFKTASSVLNKSTHQIGCACCSSKSKQKTVRTHIPIIGFFIGLVPCPSALAVSLSATKLGSIYQAIYLAIIFAGGVALTLAAIGFLVVYSSNKIGNINLGGRCSRWFPMISPVMITLLGALMIIHSGTH